MKVKTYCKNGSGQDPDVTFRNNQVDIAARKLAKQDVAQKFKDTKKQSELP